MDQEKPPPLVYEADDTFRPVGKGRELAMVQGVGLVERRTVPEEVMETFNGQNKELRDARPRGIMVGDTQRHALRVARIPGWARVELWRRTGGPRVNPKGYLRELSLLLSQHPEWATSGYRM